MFQTTNQWSIHDTSWVYQNLWMDLIRLSIADPNHWESIFWSWHCLAPHHPESCGLNLLKPSRMKPPHLVGGCNLALWKIWIVVSWDYHLFPTVTLTAKIIQMFQSPPNPYHSQDLLFDDQGNPRNLGRRSQSWLSPSISTSIKVR